MSHYLVIILSIGAMRMYRGLVDSAVLNCHTAAEPAFSTSKGISAKSDMRFAIPSESRSGCQEREKDTRDGAGVSALEENYLPSTPQRILLITKHDDGPLESETV